MKLGRQRNGKMEIVCHNAGLSVCVQCVCTLMSSQKVEREGKLVWITIPIGFILDLMLRFSVLARLWGRFGLEDRT